MTSIRAKAVLAAVLFASFSLVATWAAPADSHDADTAAIKKLYNDFNDAFNNHDAHAAAMQFIDDGEFINVAAVTTQGKGEIEQHMAPLFAGRLKTARRDVTLRGIRFLRPDLATIDSDYVTSGVMGANGETAPPAKGLYDWIVVKQNSRWLIAVWHESNLPAPAPAAK